MMLDGESRERRLMKAAQDQLLLAGIGVDVADREDAGHAGLKFLGVDLERLFLQLQAPVGDRSELRVQAEERQHVVRRAAAAWRPSCVWSHARTGARRRASHAHRHGPR